MLLCVCIINVACNLLDVIRLPYGGCYSASLVNCDCFYPIKHLFVLQITSSRMIPSVLLSQELGEWEEVCGVSDIIWHPLDGNIMEKV